jgi:hypothetical protein
MTKPRANLRSAQPETPSLIALSVIASIPKIAQLNWRKFVFEIRGAFVCKSANMSSIGFL